jgi:hypothetical protein
MFTDAPYISSISVDDLALYPMDTTYTSHGPERPGDNLVHSFHAAFCQLYAVLQELCSTIHFPPDGGVFLLSLINQKDNTLKFSMIIF